MVEYNLINPKIIKTKKSPYFANYMTKEEINNIKFPVFRRQILDNYGELSKNDWELHKQLIAEGHNPNEIAKIIRNDEIEKLQEMSSQNDFDFNQYIEESLYEKCDFINLYNVKLIDYAAFFGSIKCFKYLLINGGKLNNTGQYAIASGNEEIIHLCEQNHSSFEDAYETAIKFHRNDIFKYIYENKIIEIKDLTELAIICIQLHNYEIFLFLLEKGMKIKKVIINESARIGNLYLANYFLKTIKFPNDILVYSSQSGKYRTCEICFKSKKINLNFKYIYK